MPATYARIYALLLLLSAATAGALAVFAWRRRSVPGGLYFALVMAAVAEWAGAGAAEALATGLSVKVFFSKLSYVGICTAAPLWMLFALRYSGSDKQVPARWKAALWAIPALVLLLVVTNEWHGWIWPEIRRLTADPRSQLVYGHGWGVLLIAGYSYALTLLGSAWLVRATLRSPRILRLQSAALAIGAILPIVVNALYVLGGRSIGGLDPSPVAFAVTGLLVAHAALRHQMLDLVPVARDVLVESMGDGVVVLDARGRVADANPVARRLAPELAIGAVVASLGEPWDALFAECRETPGGRHEVAVEMEGGQRWLEMHCTAVQGRGGRVTGWLGILRDITERRRAEEERLEFERRVQRVQRLQSLGVLAGGVAHDFNNILAGVLGHVELVLLRLPEGDRNRVLLEKASAGVLRAADLTKQMLAYAGRGAPPTEHLDLARLVGSMRDMLERAIPKTARLSLDLPHEPIFAKADDGYLRQVVVNLVTNAGEAIGDREGHVTLRLRRVDALREHLDGMLLGDALPEGPYIELAVSDDGSGMDAETQARIFEPFFTTKFLGRGLGMAAVHGIVRDHGGAIQVESRLGAGTTVRILLPEAGAGGA